MKGARKATRTTTVADETREGFTAEELAAMRERAEELKASRRRGSGAEEADDESRVLAKITEMPEADRAMAERLHTIITAAAPTLTPRLWYGQPAYAQGGKIVSSFNRPPSLRRGMRRSASATRHTSTTAPCGPPVLRSRR